MRRIDWNATARTGEPHVRVHVAERALTTWLVLDASPSMTFGTADRRKADVAEGVALARRPRSRPAAATGSAWSRSASHGGRLVPPRQGRAGLLGALARAARGAGARGRRRDLAGGGARRASARWPARARWSSWSATSAAPRDWRGPLRELAARHDVIAVEIRDPREQELPDVGDLALVDPETGRQLQVDTRSRKLRERFAEAAAAEREALATDLRRAGARHVVLSTSGDWLRGLGSGLRQALAAGVRR